MFSWKRRIPTTTTINRKDEVVEIPGINNLPKATTNLEAAVAILQMMMTTTTTTMMIRKTTLPVGDDPDAPTNTRPA